jgi:hypothetical protein
MNLEYLNKRVALINDLLDVPQEPYQSERDGNGRLVTNTDVHFIGGAYGGYRLECMCKGGGARDISPRLSKGQLAEWLDAYIDGIERGLK